VSARLVTGETISPILDYVVIEPRDAFADASGIVLPEAYDDDAHGSDGDMIRKHNQLCLGIVRAVGPGSKTEAAKPGIRRMGPDGPTEHWEREPEPPEPKVSRELPDVEVGEQVVYHRASAIRIDGTDPLLVIVHEEAVFLAIEGDVHQVVGGVVAGRFHEASVAFSKRRMGIPT